MSDTPLPPPVAALFPAPAERQRIGDWLTTRLEASAVKVQAGRVTPSVEPEVLTEALEAFDLEHPRTLQQALEWTLEHMETGIVQMGNPRYFGLFNPGASFPSQCADRVAAIFNPQLASSASSPFPVALEASLIRAIAGRAGLPASAGGHFATGGSEANFTALLCALTRGHPDFAQRGARAYPGQPIFYTSKDCHIAWLKIAHQAGIGRQGLRMISTDGHGRMDHAALETAIEADLALGHSPVMVVATAGTTGAGMIDPLRACAATCAARGLWFHVDAAWGGGALASETLKPHLQGIERADSITIDAHKWFATTMGCAMYLTQRTELLPQVFQAAAVFMPSSVSAVDPYLNSVQWSRRFLGLRLFLALAVTGWQGLGRHVERSVEVTARIARVLERAGWRIVNHSVLAVLNAVPPSHLGDVRPLVRRVVASGRAWVAAAVFEGEDVVRICVTHGETSEQDIEQLLDCLNQPT